METICFLTYINRSGSTLLAKKLDQFREVSVSIESGLHHRLGEKAALNLRNDEEIDRYLDEMYESPKFIKWGIKRSTLREKLKECPPPVSLKEVLPAILRLYNPDRNIKVRIYKQNTLYRFHGELRRLFPDSKFLFIGRDPRGIYNSQKKSVDSYGKKMVTTVAEFAAYYRKTYRFIEQHLKGKDYFHFVSYESLLLDEEGEMRKLIDFLGLSGEVDEGKTDYFKKIPASQKHLHQNLKGNELKKSRMLAWEREMDTMEAMFLQNALAAILQKEQFPMVEFGNLPLAMRLKALAGQLFFLLRYRTVAAAKEILRLNLTD